MDQIQSMRMFARVVEAGSFTKAAESLDVLKGTVTKQVQHLEARLRIKLLNRTTRIVTVTAEGAAYYERAVRLLAELDDIEASMNNAQASPKGRLRVDVGASVARRIIIPALRGFYERYPDIQLDLGVGDRTVDLIADNIDCVVRGGELTEHSLVARRIGTLSFVTVAAPAYLERHGVPAHPLDLERGHRSLHFFSARSGRQFGHHFWRDGEHIEVAGHYQLSLNESNAHVSALAAGLGIAQTASFEAQPCIDMGDLMRVLPDWDGPTLPVYVVYPPNRHLSVKVRAFVDWAADLFAQHPLVQRV
jgi:LysR family transcriptional regulator for bpeEF and oprC